MFMTLGFVIGFALGWVIRWKLDGIIDWVKNFNTTDGVPNYLRGKRED